MLAFWLFAMIGMENKMTQTVLDVGEKEYIWYNNPQARSQPTYRRYQSALHMLDIAPRHPVSDKRHCARFTVR